MNGLEWEWSDRCYRAIKFCPRLLLFTVAKDDTDGLDRWRPSVSYEGMDGAAEWTGELVSSPTEAMHVADRKWAAIQAGIALVILQNTSWEEEPW